jgi:hypothetical protein
MEFEGKYIDEIIELRSEARKNKDWTLSDKIRNYLDEKLIFVFDMNWGQEVWFLPEQYFKNKDKKPETVKLSNRKYVEHRIQQDIKLEIVFDAWVYSMLHDKQ